MIRRFLCTLVLLAVLASACALAEQPAVYEPGAASFSLFADAFENGQIITGDIQLRISGSAEKLGLSDEEAALFDAVSDALQHATLSIGGGRLEDGFRVELGAAYDADSPIRADAAANITYDGLLLETSLLPGESVSIRWETLLALCGLSEKETAQVLAVRDIDLNAVLQSFADEIVPMLEAAAQYLAPYAETVAAHISALPMELQENLPDDGYYYPAAAQEISIAVSAYDAGALIIALADQLEADPLLRMLIDAALAEDTGLSVHSTAELCAAIRDAAAGLSDTDYPVQISLGMDDASEPLYLIISRDLPDGRGVTLNLVSRTAPDTLTTELYVDICTLDVQGYIFEGISGVLSFAADPLNPKINHLSAVGAFFLDGEIAFSIDYALANEAFISAEGQSGYKGSQTLSMSIENGESPIAFIMSAETQQAPTAAGGEYLLAEGTMDTYIGNVLTPVRFSNELTVTPEANGVFAFYTEKNRMPELGLDSLEEIYTLSTRAYDPAETAALKLTQIETAAVEDMNALLSRLQTAAADLGAALSEQLPPEILAQLSGPADE